MAASKRIRSLGLVVLVSAWILASGIVARAQSSDEEKLAQGAQLYAANCAVCHGPNGEGRAGATLAQNWPSVRPDLTVRSTIENGIPGSVMPAWSQANGGPLTGDEIEALVFFILSWQTGGPPRITPGPTQPPHAPIAPVPDIKGDPNRGAVLFSENCAVCHGPNGEGRAGATLAKDWPSIRPDLTIKSTIANGVSGSVMPAWSQANGGPLGDEQIDDLVAFILSRPPAAVTTGEQEEPSLSPAPVSWLRGWGGVLVFFGLLVVIVAGALILQRR